MFNWWRQRSAATGEGTPLPDLARLAEHDVAVVFKHSTSCPVSCAAHRQVKKFEADHPEIPVYTLLVQAQREQSNSVSLMTEIRHESPQVIVFRRGVAVSSASHNEVTAHFLSAAVQWKPGPAE